MTISSSFLNNFFKFSEEQLDEDSIQEPIEVLKATGSNPNNFQVKTIYFKAKNI